MWVYSKLVSASTGLVLVDNDGHAGQWAPLSTPEAFSLMIARGGKVSPFVPLTQNTCKPHRGGMVARDSGNVAPMELEILDGGGCYTHAAAEKSKMRTRHAGQLR